MTNTVFFNNIQNWQTAECKDANTLLQLFYKLNNNNLWKFTDKPRFFKSNSFYWYSNYTYSGNPDGFTWAAENTGSFPSDYTYSSPVNNSVALTDGNTQFAQRPEETAFDTVAYVKLAKIPNGAIVSDIGNFITKQGFIPNRFNTGYIYAYNRPYRVLRCGLRANYGQTSGGYLRPIQSEKWTTENAYIITYKLYAKKSPEDATRSELRGINNQTLRAGCPIVGNNALFYKKQYNKDNSVDNLFILSDTLAFYTPFGTNSLSRWIDNIYVFNNLSQSGTNANSSFVNLECYCNGQDVEIINNYGLGQVCVFDTDTIPVTTRAGVFIADKKIDTIPDDIETGYYLGDGMYLTTPLIVDNANGDGITKFFNSWGIPVTFSENAAIYNEFDPIVPASPSGGDSGIIDGLPNNGVTNNDVPIVSNDDLNRVDDFNINVPSISSIDFANARIYNYLNVRRLFNWFCDTSYFENQSDLFQDKLSAIFGLFQYPLDLVKHDLIHVQSDDITQIVSVKNDIPNYIVLPNYNTIIDGGYIDYLPYYGNYNDWTNCAYSIYIPYGGIVDIAPEYIVNRRLTIKYCVDLMTGKATAVVKSYPIGTDELGVLVKTVPCQLAQEIPVQSSNYAEKMTSIALSGIGLIGAGFGAAMAPSAGGITSVIQQGIEMWTNNQTKFSASGNLSPSTGLSLPQTPFLSISRIHLTTPTKYRSLNGITAAYYAPISSLVGNGFSQFQTAKINISNATEGEITEIKNLLANGIYL